MRRIVCLLLATAFLMPLFAGGSSEKPTNVQGDEQVVTLTISHNMDFTTIPNAVVDAAERLNARYARDGKNTRIEFVKDYQTIDWTEYQKNIVFAHKSGQAPDFYAIEDVASLIKAGLLLDITDVVTVNKDKFVTGAFTTGTVDGKNLCLPPDLPVRVIYYNWQDLRKIGWTDEQIAALPERIQGGEFTFEQFIALCKEVVDKGGAKIGLEHRPGSGADFLDVLRVLGGTYYNDKGTLVFDEEGLTRFFQFTYDNANVTGITPQNLNQMGWTTINKAVGSGDCFAYYGPVYSCNYCASAAGLTTEQFAAQEQFVMFPRSQYVNKPFVVAAPEYIGISSRTKYPEICKELIAELANGSSDYMARHAAKINSLSSVIAANADPQVMANPVIKNITYMEDYAIVAPSINGITTYMSELFKQIVALELGQTTPEKAVADMKAQILLNVKDVIFE